MGITSERAEVRTCDHRLKADIRWLNNDNMTAPIITVSGCYDMSIISLTNQVFRVSCPMCFERITRAAGIWKPAEA